MKPKSLFLISFLFSVNLISPFSSSASNGFSHMFGYTADPQQSLSYLPQWLSVLERHITEDLPEGNCEDTFFNRCHLKNWYAFLESIKNKTAREQVNAINSYANKKKYILDISNYGVDDYWAIAREFLYNGGDCEDYAITKFFSLRWLNFDPASFRLVILQDANLRIPHAVLAVSLHNDILILDNQIQRVASHREIKHYLPLYSVNGKKWWLHLPKM